MCLSHDNLVNHYKTNFALITHWNYRLEELENMLPWERAVYVEMLIQHVKDENEKAEQRKAARG